jgi:hypothetical protein
MRHKVVGALRPLDSVSVENACRSGTPDVNFTDGWIELKQLAKRPQRAATCVRLPHFTPQQRVMLRRRWHTGGKAFVLLLIDGEWLLFDGCWAARFLGDVDYGTLTLHALAHWVTGLNETELLEWISETSPLTRPCSCSQAIKVFRPSPKFR